MQKSIFLLLARTCVPIQRISSPYFMLSHHLTHKKANTVSRKPFLLSMISDFFSRLSDIVLVLLPTLQSMQNPL